MRGRAAALGHVGPDDAQFDHQPPLCLPSSTDPLIAAVMEYTRGHLDHVVLHDVCRAIGISERSLRRVFPAATGMSWRRYVLESRLPRAMALLSDPERTVLEVATLVGSRSVSAFIRSIYR
ncbi:helix-turn-helix transcriptional regulator [Nocardia sp. NBC_00565]|uniref:helix-turn-helix transcriptional regulator n=1 Tax=Nocardia sp. NBC_00565 TaxID=2975993 RepID=UPI002E810054|nr:helix-turn-helix transcriptional regulator [Nocardia sp. NBC_00565]WUC05620.1 helix-turn-helix transcriptional regulator [Nocardia sp. NBC_00565]